VYDTGVRFGNRNCPASFVGMILGRPISAGELTRTWPFGIAGPSNSPGGSEIRSQPYCFLTVFTVKRAERVIEHVVAHAPSLSNALYLIERPMDAEVDAALAVLLLCLG
jgi:hypothetical protein